MTTSSPRPGLANKILITMVLLLALAAILGFIVVGAQGDALDAIFGSANETEDKIDEKKSGLLDMIADAFSGGSESSISNSFTPSTVSGSDVQGAVGGGPEYVQELRSQGKQTFCQPPQDATVVSTTSGFVDAMQNAGAGDVIYIEGGAKIDITQAETLILPQDATLASNRGCDGAPGGMLYIDDHSAVDKYSDYQIEAKSGSTVTGIRLKGVHMEYFNPKDAGCREGGDVDWYCQTVFGLKIQNGEVHNTEVFGWTYAIAAGGNSHIHHNHIHHNPYESLGYGVHTADNPLIEYNYFNYNRHSIASTYTTSYEARYNIVGPDWVGHQFDVHGKGKDGHVGGQAGVEVRIHHNTFQATKDLAVKTRNPGGDQQAIAIRGTPKKGAWIENNWFYHSSQDAAFIQRGGDGNIHFTGNHYGTNPPSNCDIGAPRDGCSSPSLDVGQ